MALNIEHIVLSGGGHIMLQMMGILQELQMHNVYDLKKVKTIYATSAGGMVGVLLCLSVHMEMSAINTYLLNRPWHKVFHIHIQTLFEMYEKRGIYDYETLTTCFESLFISLDLPTDITLKGLFEFSGIELHVMTFDINHFQLVNVSYLTFPDLSVVRAIQMTSAIPLLLCPVIYEHGCYIDGGIMCNNPIDVCLYDVGGDGSNILSIKNGNVSSIETRDDMITEKSNLFDFIVFIIWRVFRHVTTPVKLTAKYEIACSTGAITINMLNKVFGSKEERVKLYDDGKSIAGEFINTHGLAK